MLSPSLSDRPEIERRLRESERGYRALFDQAAVGVVQVELATGRIVAANQRYCEIAGYPDDAVASRPFLDMPGMTGAETLPRILEIRPKQLVLISTGFSETNLSGLANGNPGIRSLRKPFTAGELQDALSALSARKD